MERPFHERTAATLHSLRDERVPPWPEVNLVMCGIFTEHVRHFGTPSDPASQVLPELGRVLKQRMRRRHLLLAPPAYLGYVAPNWDRDEAWQDLVADCYVFILRRLGSLRNQLGVTVAPLKPLS